MNRIGARMAEPPMSGDSYTEPGPTIGNKDPKLLAIPTGAVAARVSMPSSGTGLRIYFNESSDTGASTRGPLIADGPEGWGIDQMFLFEPTDHPTIYMHSTAAITPNITWYFSGS